LNCPYCNAENQDGAPACFTCGRALGVLTKGAILARRYEILATLGQGGMGTVYKAHDRGLDEIVAIKVIRADVAANPEVARRFRSEIKLARRISHRNVCRIYEYGDEGGFRFIAMEFVQGLELRDYVRRKGALGVEEAFDIVSQVAEGLGAIHEAGVLHRDLKSRNIMIDHRGIVRLMDFGIAKQFGVESATSATATGMVVGTPEYMSPEQARGEKVDFRSDIYALGVVVYEIFAGELPFRAETPLAVLFKHIQEPPPLDGPAAQRIPKAVRPVLARALAKNPRDRFPTAQALAAAVGDAKTVEMPAVVQPRDLAPEDQTVHTEAPTAPGQPVVPEPTPPPMPATERIVTPPTLRRATPAETPVPSKPQPAAPRARVETTPPAPRVETAPPVRATPPPAARVETPGRAARGATPSPSPGAAPAAPRQETPPPSPPLPVSAAAPLSARQARGETPGRPTAPPRRDAAPAPLAPRAAGPRGPRSTRLWYGVAAAGALALSLVAVGTYLAGPWRSAPPVEGMETAETPATVAAPGATDPEIVIAVPAPSSIGATVPASATPAAGARGHTPSERRTTPKPPSRTRPAATASLAASRRAPATPAATPPPTPVHTPVPTPTPAPTPPPRAATPEPVVAPATPIGTLQLTVLPYAEVFDGARPLGRVTVKSLELSVGRHRLRLVHPDFEPLRRVVRISEGKKSTLTIDWAEVGVRKAKK
jgi:serine/threonine-protein kinase